MTCHSFPSTPPALIAFLFSVALVLATCIRPVRGTRLLHDALLEDILPPTSPQCSAGAPSTPASPPNFVHSPPSSESEWSHLSAEFEDDLFRFEMDNGLNLTTDPKSWRIRVGRGGNIYSLVGMFGEAVPPQHHANAPFIDEVYQTVAVNGALNKPEVGEAYFIHQAGCYVRDGLTEPFFSRSLHPSSIVAEQCDGNQCSAAAWGQHAHIPTVYEGSALYFNRYADCGLGVMEHTTVVHNAAEQSSGTGDHLDYFNVPWTGVRTSTFRDLLISTPGNAQNATHIDPHPAWGDNANGLRNLEQTGGYSIYAQDLLNEVHMPCGSAVTKRETDCPGDGQVALVMGNESPCSHSAGHTSNWGRNVTRCYLGPNIVEVRSGSNQLFKIRGTDDIIVEGVMHWSWVGRWFYFFTETATVKDELNGIFGHGDLMELDLVDDWIPYEENLALAYVHGDGREKANLGMSISDLRFGTAGPLDRDTTIFTVRAAMDLPPGHTYVKRQYMIADMLHEMDGRARGWVNETFEDVLGPADRPGRTVTLYRYQDDSDVTFGASVSDEEDCSHGVARYTCVGSTAPKVNHVPFFAIECDGSGYVGEDQYGLSPEYGEGYLRPYVCEGEDASARPSYRLLGYFPEGACSEFQDWRYDAEKCEAPEFRNDVTEPEDEVSMIGAVANGTGEAVEMAIDGTSNKFLTFGGSDPPGLVITPAVGLTKVTGIKVYQANDAPERDPASYVLEGSACDGTCGEPWVTISEGVLNLPDARIALGLPLEQMSAELVGFENDELYSFYRLTFPTVKDAVAANSFMQVAEVELVGFAHPFASENVATCDALSTCEPSLQPSASPSDIPTSAPSSGPSSDPSVSPSSSPSSDPSSVPSGAPSVVASSSPSSHPSSRPSSAPSSGPSSDPSLSPSSSPSSDPSSVPSGAPSVVASSSPSSHPSSRPSSAPSSGPSTSVPSGAPSRCYQLIANGDIANGAVGPWWPYVTPIEARSPGADGTGWALAATGAGRSNFGYGTHQKFDQDCLTEGEQWTVSASFKLVNDTSGEEVWCDVNNHVLGHANSCPWYRIFSRDVALGQYHGPFRQFTWDAQWNATTYNRATGTFTVASENVSYDWVRLIIMGPRPGLTILMDDVTMTPAA